MDLSGEFDRATTIRVLRFLVAALLSGLLSFAAIVLFVLEPFERQGDPIGGVLLGALLALAAVEAVAYRVVRKVLVARLRRLHGDEPPGENEPALLEGYRTLTLIGAALTEAVGVFALVVYLVAASRPALLVAGAAAALLVLSLPSADRFCSFAEQVTGRRPAE